MTPDERFGQLVAELAAMDGVTAPTPGRGFGSGALRWRKKIFAMLVRGQLVLKLPAARVDALIAAGHGVRYDANRGTPMREWIAMRPGSSVDWSAAAREALAFVSD